MKTSILLFMSVLFSYSAQASNIPPVAVLNSTPNQTWFYNLEDVVFNKNSSYDTDGYINYAKWYINGVYEEGGAYYGSMSICFALYGSPSNGCYQLADGITTVTVGLEVRDNEGKWSLLVTENYTIQEHKGRKYFVKDHLGNVRTTVNRDGNVLGHDDYYPFGLVMPGRSSNSANPNDNYKFTGHELDDEAGMTMYHANARGYDPVLGRFMQIDPMSHLYPGISPFAYAMNNPLLYIDPTGETVECSTKEDCDKAAADINETHEGAGVEVAEKERTVTKGFLWWKKETTETYYELTTGNEDFDWTQGGSDEFGAAVYDLLASEDVVMNVVYTTGEVPWGNTNASIADDLGGGFFDDKTNTVYVDPRGGGDDPSSVILMHEMLGHGHPVGGPYTKGAVSYAEGNALRVHNHYRTKLGIPGRRTGRHGAFQGDRRLNNWNNDSMQRMIEFISATRGF